MKLDARMFALVGFLSVIASTDDSLASLPSTRRPLVRPECDNTPLPDPASAVQTMAVHEAIANYLLDPRAKPRFTCRSQRMQYIGTRAEDEIHVISTYIASNQRHADYVISKSKDSGWGPHGVMKSWWRNGKPQSSEYFCGGTTIDRSPPTTCIRFTASSEGSVRSLTVLPMRNGFGRYLQ
jgi:hypothetical protein